MELNELSEKIIGAAIEVHRELGPGLFESTNERALVHELGLRGINAERQKVQPIVYKGLNLDEGYRIDILVEGRVVLELKATETLSDLFTAQVLPYLRLSGCKLGLLINFNVPLLKDGIRRIVNQIDD